MVFDVVAEGGSVVGIGIDWDDGSWRDIGMRKLGGGWYPIGGDMLAKKIHYYHTYFQIIIFILDIGVTLNCRHNDAPNGFPTVVSRKHFLKNMII